MITLVPIESIVSKIVFLRSEKALLDRILLICMMLRPSI
jgi:hypothetical protein